MLIEPTCIHVLTDVWLFTRGILQECKHVVRISYQAVNQHVSCYDCWHANGMRKNANAILTDIFCKLKTRKKIWCPTILIHYYVLKTLHWRHYRYDDVSNHQHHDCLLNRLFRHKSKKTPKLRVTGLYEGNTPMTDEFPAQRSVNRKMFPLDDIIMNDHSAA